MKKCRSCGETSEHVPFSRNRLFKDGVDTICKKCKSEWGKSYYQKNKKSILLKQKKWNRKKDLKKKFNITLDQYGEMLNNQNGVCAICKRKNKKTLAVDHNHSTGRIRGLLCGNCNWAIGLFLEDIGILTSAIEYLSKEK